MAIDLSTTPRSRPSARPRPGAARGGLTSEVVLVVAIALSLALIVKTFVAQPFFIPSGSMEPGLQIGDRVLVNRSVPMFLPLQRGDIVVFKDPGGWLDNTPPPPTGVQGALVNALTFLGVIPRDANGHLVKRVIGLPGDHVVCCDAGGRISVNGTALDEPYLYPGDAPSTLPFDVTVPAGRLWVLGDHRANSADSRYHQQLAGGGTVPIGNVVGTVTAVIWPLARAGAPPGAGTTFAGVPPAAATP